MPKYAIVVESGGDVPPNLAEKYDISIVPMHLSLGNDNFDDGDLSVEEVLGYYDKTKQLPTTSGCTPADFTKVFDEIHARNPEAQIIHLAYSAITTVSYESACIAAEGRDYVHHFDTKNVSYGQAMIVLSVAEYIANNPDVEMEELTRVIEDRIPRGRLNFLPGDLSYLHAGGRLSNASYLGAQLLKVLPCIELIDGKLVAKKMYRGPMLKVAQKMTQDFFKRETYESHLLYLLTSPGLNSNVKDAVEELVDKLGIKYAGWLVPGCVILCHGGPKAFGIGALASS